MSRDVTVLIPCYRNADIIGDAVRSALGQTVEPQVIVIDDASGDGTADAARAAGEGSSRLIVMSAETNQGPGAARNLGLDRTGTPWVALLDSDDRMAPDRLEKLLAVAREGGWDFVADDILRVTDWERPEAGRRLWRDEPVGLVDLDLARFVRENIAHHTGRGRELGFVKPLMSTRFLNQHGLRYNPAMRLAEDYDLYARALLAGARFCVTDPLGYLAFDTPGSLSKAHRAEALEQVYRADRRLLGDPRLPESARRHVREHLRLSHEKWAWVRLIEAVKARNPVGVAGSFLAPPGIVASLFARLAERLRQGRPDAAREAA